MWIIWPGTVISTIFCVRLVILLLLKWLLPVRHSWSIRDLFISFSAWKRPAMFLMDPGYCRIFSMIYMYSAACSQSPHVSLLWRQALCICHLLWRQLGCCLAHILRLYTQFSTNPPVKWILKCEYSNVLFCLYLDIGNILKVPSLEFESWLHAEHYGDLDVIW